MLKRTLLATALTTMAPLSLGATLDFTDTAIWGGANGATSFMATDDGITATLIATGGNMTTNATGDQAGCAASIAPLACLGDGIGIVDDEVSGGGTQSLTLSFDSAVNVNSISFLDLFDENPAESVTLLVMFAAGGSSSFTATSPGSNPGGFLEWTAGPLNGVTSIEFSAATLSSSNDFALAAANVSAVPLPAAAWLFGSALLGLVTVARRKTS